jgi:hypothetical protein
MADYRMRGWQNVLGNYVYWVSAGQPDWTGAQSGYPQAQIDDAVVVAVIATGGGVDPGQGGGEFEYPPMTMEPYNPAAIDIDSVDQPDPPNPGYFYPDMMTEHDGPKVESMITFTGWNTGDMIPMAEHP